MSKKRNAEEELFRPNKTHKFYILDEDDEVEDQIETMISTLQQTRMDENCAPGCSSSCHVASSAIDSNLTQEMPNDESEEEPWDGIPYIPLRPPSPYISIPDSPSWATVTYCTSDYIDDVSDCDDTNSVSEDSCLADDESKVEDGHNTDLKGKLYREKKIIESDFDDSDVELESVSDGETASDVHNTTFEVAEEYQQLTPDSSMEE